jgi:hypothetical protein
VVNTANLSIRAKGYDIPGKTVDGNDVLAIYEAVGYARAGTALHSLSAGLTGCGLILRARPTPIVPKKLPKPGRRKISLNGIGNFSLSSVCLRRRSMPLTGRLPRKSRRPIILRGKRAAYLESPWAFWGPGGRDVDQRSGVCGNGGRCRHAGLRPIVEVMYIGFIGVCMDQVMNQAAKLRYMTGGQVKIPMVIRTLVGSGDRSAGQHSQCLETLFTNIPGLKVVCPSTPAEAKGLMKTAIRDEAFVVLI